VQAHSEHSIRYDYYDLILCTFSGLYSRKHTKFKAYVKTQQGILQNGLVVCVKKLAENLQIPAGKQFDNEATNLLVAQHENIVKLLGFCRKITKKVVEHNARFILVDKDECVLCYEHVPRGSLHDYLSGMAALLNN